MRFTIQEHAAKKAGLHWDLRLETPEGDLSEYEAKRNFSTTPEPPPGSGAMASWSIPKHRLPKKGERLLAVPTEDHPLSYQNFEGEIKEGYGAGSVKLIANGDYALEKRNEDSWKFTLPEFGSFKIVPMKGRKGSLIIGLGE
jgi:hypothetical protein